MNFEKFKKIINETEKSEEINDSLIECAFITLSRACSDEELENIP